VALEREVLGLAVSAHPLAMFRRERERLARTRGLVRSVDMPRHVGGDVAIVGWKVTVKGARTMNRGEAMVFVTFSDEWGRFEATLFPRVYRRTARELVRGRGPFLVRGRVESELGVESLVAADLRLVIAEDIPVGGAGGSPVGAAAAPEGDVA
jgi:DNA polymerase III alpha subunit